MARLVTGEFNNRADAEQVMDDLIRAGIPRDQIYVETELPPDELRGRKGGEVAMAERERRIAGTETGSLVGAILGIMGGLLLAALNHAILTATDSNVSMAWPVNSSFWCAVIGGLLGLAVGAAMGATVDYTLSRLGAGPAPAREECLVTVHCDDAQLDTTRDVFWNHRARHILGAMTG
jgi:hypothetical protein